MIARIDLSTASEDCFGSPIVTLLKYMRGLREGQGLEMVVEEGFPGEIVRSMVRNLGFGLKCRREGDSKVCILYRPG